MTTSQNNRTDVGVQDLVMIIHGTFARDSDWIKPQSAFFKTLQSRVGPHTVRSFTWSGENSHRARIDAGRELAQYVNGLCSSEGYQRVWCIVHSHGGNVALFALRNIEFRHRLAGIAFLGTPFLHIKLRNLEAYCSIFSKALSFLFVFPIFPLYLAFFIFIVKPVGTWFIIWVIFTIIGCWAFLRYQERLFKYVERKLLSFLLTRQHRTDLWIAQPKPSCPTYVATVSKDEAGIVLSFFDRLAEVPRFVLASIVRITAPAVATYYVYYYWLFTKDHTILNLGGSVYFAAFFLCVPLIVVLGSILYLFINATIRGTHFAFGWEGFLSGCTLRIKPSHEPIWTDKTTSKVRYPIKKTIRGIRHSFFYNDKRVIDDVAHWIRNNGQFIGQVPPVRTPSKLASILAHKWVVTVTASIFTLVICNSLTSYAVNRASIPKYDLDNSVESIQESAPFIFEIDQTVAAKKLSLRSEEVNQLVVYSEMKVAHGATCTIEGNANFFNWDTTVRVDLIGQSNKMMTTDEGNNDAVFRTIWSWNSGEGKKVHFRKRFRNEFYGPMSQVKVIVWNESPIPTHLKAKIYIDCGQKS